ncbi:MAG: hypothetical protein Q9218_007340, partial [Villophora microphyllina]
MEYFSFPPFESYLPSSQTESPTSPVTAAGFSSRMHIVPVLHEPESDYPGRGLDIALARINNTISEIQWERRNARALAQPRLDRDSNPHSSDRQSMGTQTSDDAGPSSSRSTQTEPESASPEPAVACQLAINGE